VIRLRELRHGPLLLFLLLFGLEVDNDALESEGGKKIGRERGRKSKKERVRKRERQAKAAGECGSDRAS
jgi:hypothetical protein